MTYSSTLQIALVVTLFIEFAVLFILLGADFNNCRHNVHHRIDHLLGKSHTHDKNKHDHDHDYHHKVPQPIQIAAYKNAQEYT